MIVILLIFCSNTWILNLSNHILGKQECDMLLKIIQTIKIFRFSVFAKIVFLSLVLPSLFGNLNLIN